MKTIYLNYRFLIYSLPFTLFILCNLTRISNSQCLNQSIDTSLNFVTNGDFETPYLGQIHTDILLINLMVGYLIKYSKGLAVFIIRVGGVQRK